MKNIKKIFEVNPKASSDFELRKGSLFFYVNDEIFSGETISKVINFVNSVHKKYKNINIPIVFKFGNVILADKLSYILFECICYSLMVNYKHMVYVEWNPRQNILTEGVFSSPINLLNGGSKKSASKYPDKFKMDIYLNHFRRVINSENRADTNYLGNLFQELDTFLKFFNIIEEYRDQISEVISELVGNACEHADGDCLLDIDITTDHLKEVKNIKQDGMFYGINIVIVNFSDILLGDGIKEKIKSQNLTARYADLNKAFQYHKCNFSGNYTENDFFNISTLQDKISGRPHHNIAGGTGLTKLIHSLQEKSDNDNCYVLSGNRCVMFIKDLLKYDDNEWLGFNEDNNFFSNIPEKSVIRGCYVDLPGTAYNLNFVMKREDEIIE